jgi:CDP-glycerol glycerophosphotransferase (TagB/SpsB family)
MSNVSNYKIGSLDFYDAVLMIGDHEEKPIRTVESARQTQKKELATCGLPYLDYLSMQKKKTESLITEKPEDIITVLVAPSWGSKGCFSAYGLDFVKDLSQAGYSIIIRIHPHSLNFEPDAVIRWQKETATLQNVKWDTETTGTKAMLKADILVSDTSSIRFDFAFLYNKPVITLDIPKESRE